MIDLYPDHCEIIKDSLQGTRAIDEQTFASLEVLSERLERVKKLSDKFAHIAFSPAVNQLRKHPSGITV
jgi:hypothetical protein